MNRLAYAVLFLGIVLLGYMLFSLEGTGYVGDNLAAVHLYNARHDRSQEVYRSEQLVPDNYNVPRSQKLLGVSFGRAPCVRCRRDNGNCYWLYPGQPLPNK